MFQHLLGYYGDNSGAVPGPHMASVIWPTFQFCDDEGMTTQALCMEVRGHRVGRELEKAMTHTSDVNKTNPRKALGFLLERIAYLETISQPTNDTFFSQAMGQLKDEYQRKLRGEVTGVHSWPWEPLQRVTGGIQPDDYIIIYGRPKSMKSFVLSYLAAHAYMQGGKPLFYTKEMRSIQIFRRIAAFCMGLMYNDLRLATLSDDQLRAFDRFHDDVLEEESITGEEHTIVAVSGKDANGSDTIPWLKAKAKKYKPTILFIDGLYLMKGHTKTQKDNERVRDISRAARDLALDLEIPVIATMQATRSAAAHEESKLEEIAYSDAISQDTTLAIRTINEVNRPTLALAIGAGSREFELNGIRIHGIPCTNFNFLEMLDAKDIERAKVDDGSEPPDRHKKVEKEPVKHKRVSPEERMVNEQLDKLNKR